MMLGQSATGATGATAAELASEYLMLCAVLTPLSFGAMAAVTIFHFRRLYLNATFDTWKLKFNKVYPTVPAVTNEIYALSKALFATVMLMAVSAQLGCHGYNSLFDLTKATATQNAVNFIICFWAVDFYSYAYHLVGHKVPEAWAFHRFHHKFYNPTPFGVIADDCVDQVVRAMPLLFLPLLIDTLNVAVLACVFACDVWYGVLLHTGHESRTTRKVATFFQGLTGTDIINTPLNHFLHHAISGGSTPKYCGFYVTLWDKLFGSEDKEHLQKYLEGLETRTEEEFAKTNVPDYGVMGSLGYWMQAIPPLIRAEVGLTKKAA